MVGQFQGVMHRVENFKSLLAVSTMSLFSYFKNCAKLFTIQARLEFIGPLYFVSIQFLSVTSNAQNQVNNNLCLILVLEWLFLSICELGTLLPSWSTNNLHLIALMLFTLYSQSYPVPLILQLTAILNFALAIYILSKESFIIHRTLYSREVNLQLTSRDNAQFFPKGCTNLNFLQQCKSDLHPHHC